MKLNQKNKLTFLIIAICFVVFTSCNKNVKQSDASKYEYAKVEKCKSSFATARQFQKSGKLDRAIVAFKACLKYQSVDKMTRDSLSFPVNNSMLQLMNCYQACGKTQECVEYFKNQYLHPETPMIRNYFMRDLCSIYAYALYRNDNTDEAKNIIQKALTMHYDQPTHEQLFRDYSFAAAIFYNDVKQGHLVMRYGRIALKESEYCKHTSGVQWLITVMANHYDHQGEINKAIALYERAIKVAKEKQDTLGEMHSYIALSDIYNEWDMPSYANDCASRAVEKLNTMGEYPDIIASAYISKAWALKALGHYDSMAVCINQAKTYCRNLPYCNGMSQIEYLEGTRMVEKGNRDTLMQGIGLLKNVARKGMMNSKTKAFYMLAKTYFKLGDNKSGEVMLDSMYNMMHQTEEPYYINGASLFALNHYIKCQDDKNIIRYSKELARESNFNQSRRVTNRLANLIVQMNTEKKEQLLRYYKVEAENEQLKLSVIVFISFMAFLLAIPIFIYSRKSYQIKNLLMMGRLNLLTRKMKEEAERQRNMKKKHAAIQEDERENESLYDLSFDLIKEDGMSEFNNNFCALYPQFIPELNRLVGRLGPREELLCMLTALHQNNHQISDILGIAYRRVMISKYRLKQKMQLGKNDDFDAAICEIAKQEKNV